MEHKIMEVLRKMQSVLGDEELRELKNVLHMVFAQCDAVAGSSNYGRAFQNRNNDDVLLGRSRERTASSQKVFECVIKISR